MSSPTKVFNGGSNNMTVLVPNDSLWIPNSSQSFHCAKSMVSFENDTKLKATSTASFFQPIVSKEEQHHDDDDEEENDNDDTELSQQTTTTTTTSSSSKKRRLSTNQVQFLEKSFEVENKLEPERKVQLAKELGLLPRQVAIWFQNRRARFKTKQLEKDYDALRANFDSLKSDYDNLLKENDTLRTQVNSLKEKLAVKEKGKECLEVENAIVVKAASEGVSNAPILVCKQEDASSAKSDVFDSSSDDSPHYAENNYSIFLEPADSSHVFEPEQSDFSQDEDDDLIMRKSFLAPSPFLPKIEACYYDDPPSSSCNLEFAVEDQSFNFWPY